MKIELHIAEHSICHPGLPLPQGESHEGSLSDFDFFHKAKSPTFRFSLAKTLSENSAVSSVFLAALGLSLG